MLVQSLALKDMFNSAPYIRSTLTVFLKLPLKALAVFTMQDSPIKQTLAFKVGQSGGPISNQFRSCAREFNHWAEPIKSQSRSQSLRTP